MNRALLLLALALAVPASGCGIGSDDAAPSDDTDIRTAMMDCFEDAGIENARLVGEEGNEEIVVGEGEGAPRVRFFLTAGESEAAHFQGKGEGSEQIGAAWLYVNDGEDEVVEDMENCLADQ
jgi:hypothetical protein